MAGDTDSVTIGHLQEMAPGVSNGHLTGDVQWRIQNVRKEGAQGIWGTEVPQWAPGAKPQ